MNPTRRLRVGSRKSPLSLAQTDEVLTELRKVAPRVEFEVVSLSTGGDRNKDAPLLSLGRGTFVKDIELALLNDEIDMAVHSAKDLPPDLPDGLAIAAATERADPRDVVISKDGKTLDELPTAARIGTSSPRRTAQILALRPELAVVPIRGNVGTRVEKARGDQYDAVVLAAAGLLRLGMGDEITEYLAPEVCTPEVGQGTLAIEARSDDSTVSDLLAKIEHGPSSIVLRAERAFLAALGGGCKVPVTAFARIENRGMRIDAMAAEPDGSRIFRTSLAGDPQDPESAGRQVADQLLATGARRIIETSSS